MTTADQHLLSVDAFWAHYGDERYELISGVPVKVPVPGVEHGEIAVLISAALLQFVKPQQLGRVGSETGYFIKPGTLRMPDVSFLSEERRLQVPDKTKYVPFAPDLAIEIISPSENHSTVRQKVQDYRAGGVKIVWLVYPQTKEIDVHYLQEKRSEYFGYADTLTLDTVLPGFALPLAQIFAD